jgi:hypothetical protein
MMVGPVLVTVEAPRTAKLCAEPSGDWADAAEALRTIAAKGRIAESRITRRREERFILHLPFPSYNIDPGETGRSDARRDDLMRLYAGLVKPAVQF